MKRVTVEFTIQASVEFEVPDDADEYEIDRLGRAAARKEAGHLSDSIIDWYVEAPE